MWLTKKRLVVSGIRTYFQTQPCLFVAAAAAYSKEAGLQASLQISSPSRPWDPRPSLLAPRLPVSYEIVSASPHTQISCCPFGINTNVMVVLSVQMHQQTTVFLDFLDSDIFTLEVLSRFFPHTQCECLICKHNIHLNTFDGVLLTESFSITSVPTKKI